MRWNVLIPDRLEPPADVEAAVFGDRADVVLKQATHADQIDPATWSAADAVLAWHELDFTPAVIDRLNNCKIIVRVGVGYDNVDLDAAAAAGIPVCNVPDYGTGDVADHAMALLLSLARGVTASTNKLRTGNEHHHWRVAGRQKRLAGATLGVIGLGRIGTAVALRAKAFGLQVVFHDPYLPDGMDKALGVERCATREELLARSDFVSLHTPLTPETRGMGDAAFFAALKSGAILVNTARGAIVDLDALHAALKSGHLKAAGVDVLPVEPPDRAHPLLRDWSDGADWLGDRLVITPHFAFWCDEAYAEMRRKAAETALAALEGREVRNVVNGVRAAQTSGSL
jgi:phosphoglycerate dehydrogenase-like enzyme